MKNIFLFLIIGALLCGCGEKVEPGTVHVSRPSVSGVETMEAAFVTVPQYYDTSATIKAENVTVIASRLMGAVTSVLVKEGQTVDQDQLLMTMDSSDTVQKMKAAEAAYQEAQNAMDAAKSSMELAETTFDRFQKLYNDKALSRQELDQAATKKTIAGHEYQRLQAMVTRAAAGIKEAQVFLDFASIRSPVKGVVIKKHIDLGSMASPGMPLLTVEDSSSLEIEARVAESHAQAMSVNKQVVIHIPSLDLQMEGRISEIVPTVDPISRTFLIKIAFDNQNLRPGLYAKISIPLGEKQVLALPENILVRKGQLTGVYAVDHNNIITYRLVRDGRHFDDKVEILSGLSIGETIISGGLDRVVDGGILQGESN